MRKDKSIESRENESLETEEQDVYVPDLPAPDFDEKKLKAYRRAGKPDESSSAGLDVSLPTADAVRADDGLRRYYGYENSRRRSPRRRRFTRFAILFSIISFILIIAMAVVGWALAGIWSSSSADAFVTDLVETTDAAGWRQLLRIWLPESYPEYEDSRRLAGDVLSPAFNPGSVSWLKKTDGSGVYMLFSDGEYFADLTVENDREKGRHIGKIEFRMPYFDGKNGISFPERKIIAPRGATLTVNSAVYSEGADEKAVLYPYFSPVEPSVSESCVEYTFRDVYFEPVLSATLDGVPLAAVWSDDRLTVCFRYPDSYLKTVKITVPAGADAFAGGRLLTEEWAAREFVSGELGPLDDNGTGTLPQLAVWTFGGLFGIPEVRASISGEEVKLVSSSDGNFVFEIPPSCQYTVRVTAPAGADVTVNGVKVTAADAADPSEAGPGVLSGTFIGRFGGGRIPAVSDGGTQLFLTYVRKGYLAPPVVEASYGGVVLTPDLDSLSGYVMTVEYDIPPSDGTPEAAPFECASHFFKTYLKYVCDGGTSNGRESAFESNYDELLSSMVEGSAGYTGVMESYRTVYKLPNRPGAVIAEPVCAGMVIYNSGCVVLTLESSVLTDPPPAEGEEPGAPQTSDASDPVPAGMTVLVIKTGETWQVYGFECVFEIPSD